jgi:hypothetical protein
MALQLGDPIWVESLMNIQEWKNRCRKYPTSHLSLPPAEFDSEFKWRKGMGASIPEDKRKLINDRLDILMREKGLIK